MRRDGRHVGTPRVDLPLADTWLRAVIDNDRKTGMPVEDPGEPCEMPRQYERIEDEAMSNERVECGAQRGAKQPVVVGLVLHHRPKSDEQRVLGERRDLGRCINAGERCPADDARDERSRRRQGEEETGLGDGRRGLHEDRSVDTPPGDDWRKISRQEVAVDRAQTWREPAVVAALDPPEVLVRIGHRRHSLDWSCGHGEGLRGHCGNACLRVPVRRVAQHHRRHRGDPFATAGKAQALGGGRFHADVTFVASEVGR